jgi:hypothetical protein
MVMLLGASLAVQAQTQTVPSASPSASSDWGMRLVMLVVGFGLGFVVALWWKGRKASEPVAQTRVPEPGAKPAPAQNVARKPDPWKEVEKLPVLSDSKPKPAQPDGQPRKQNVPKPVTNRPAPAAKPVEPKPKEAVPVSKTAPMNPTPTPPVTTEAFTTGETVDLTPKPVEPASITELIDADATAQTAVPSGPVSYYAPAPDVPSIEHRKLSPNALPQMPLLITLPNPDATKAEYRFSPEADQSRIIGNGVRELKEFFAFELPPTEQFTTIQHLSAGKLEKRDDTWHVVQKASIALS